MFFVIGFILIIIGLVVAHVLREVYENGDNCPAGFKFLLFLLLFCGCFFMLGSVMAFLWVTLP